MSRTVQRDAVVGAAPLVWVALAPDGGLLLGGRLLCAAAQVMIGHANAVTRISTTSGHLPPPPSSPPRGGRVWEGAGWPRIVLRSRTPMTPGTPAVSR